MRQTLRNMTPRHNLCKYFAFHTTLSIIIYDLISFLFLFIVTLCNGIMIMVWAKKLKMLLEVQRVWSPTLSIFLKDTNLHFQSTTSFLKYMYCLHSQTTETYIVNLQIQLMLWRLMQKWLVQLKSTSKVRATKAWSCWKRSNGPDSRKYILRVWLVLVLGSASWILSESWA